MEEKEILNRFGEMFIDKVRNYTLWQMDNIFTGELKSEDAQKLHAKLRHFSPKDMEIIKEVSTEAIDRALFETMSMFETSEDFIIGAVNDEEIINLNYISDGLGGEYDQWIDEFSEKE
ncbi:MAG: hypothetical protein ACLR14_12515 [Phocaeicola vulgatus]